MIKVYRIEEFVVNEMFRPFAPDFIESSYGMEYKKEHRKIETFLRNKPEKIIDMLEQNPVAKENVFRRLNMFGVKFYKYLDMGNEIIQYVKKGMQEN